jgi:hypothetical protein
MGLMVIVVLSLVIIFVFADMFRESQRKKWYRRGYIDASIKYDDEQYRSNPHKEEANESFDSQYGFDYD